MGVANIYSEQVANNLVITAGDSEESRVINLKDYLPSGFLSLQLEVSGSGMLKVEPLLSVNGSDFLKPTGTPNIVDNFGSSSGPEGDGKDILNVDLGQTAPYLKLKFTETGGSNSVTVNAWLAIQ